MAERAQGESAWRLARLTGIGGDGARALWAWIYWNARKTWFVARGRRGGAPCQHRIDVEDGVAPQCEAVWHWKRPGRFRRVCPALTRTPDGWRCSVAAGRVRPYWGRALAVYAVLAAMTYAGATTTLWAVWRAAGYREIAFADVAWPGRWSRVKPAQARAFRAQGEAALARGDYPAALLALATADTFQQGGYADRMLVARLWAQAGNVAFAERDVRALMREFPERAEATAVAWHDQLLASGHLVALARLSRERVAARGGQRATESVWEFSLLYALDHGRRATRASEWDLTEMPARVRGLVAVLARWQDGDRDGATRLLADLRFARDERLAARCQVEWLARLGHAAEAGVALNRHAGALGAFETAALRYVIDATAGNADAARANFLGMLRGGPLTRAEADRVCALVIAARDGASLRRTQGVFAGETSGGHAPTQAALWVAALACREPSLVAKARARYEAATGGEALPRVAGLDFRKQNAADRESPLFIASFVPLPRETVYALIAETARAEER